jgi:cytochrome b subunit of formate dehydrogenase
MTGLVVAVFLFFGLHTVLWALRDTIDVLRHGRPRPMFSRGPAVRRFRWGDRVVHLCIMVSFIGLAATGAPLRFAETAWTQTAFELTGGPEVAGWLHRIFGLVVLAGFILHLALITIRMWPHIVGGRFLKFMMGPESLVPRPGDFIDVFANFRYFLGLGPKPSFDRWTYWEKFTYWAVFWTVPILGFSGLVLWIPEAITNVLPGWMINVAGLVFNSSLRPAKFPLDESIFTGSVPMEAYKRERPQEWARLEREGRTERVRTEPPSRGSRFMAYLIGILGWAVGLAVLAASVAGFIATR